MHDWNGDQLGGDAPAAAPEFFTPASSVQPVQEPGAQHAVSSDLEEIPDVDYETQVSTLFISGCLKHLESQYLRYNY